MVLGVVRDKNGLDVKNHVESTSVLKDHLASTVTGDQMQRLIGLKHTVLMVLENAEDGMPRLLNAMILEVVPDFKLVSTDFPGILFAKVTWPEWVLLFDGVEQAFLVCIVKRKHAKRAEASCDWLMGPIVDLLPEGSNS